MTGPITGHAAGRSARTQAANPSGSHRLCKPRASSIHSSKLPDRRKNHMYALTADPSEQKPVLRVSTKYMETFQPQKPVSGGADISTYLNSRGELDVYSVGSTNAVHRI